MPKPINFIAHPLLQNRPTQPPEHIAKQPRVGQTMPGAAPCVIDAISAERQSVNLANRALGNRGAYMVSQTEPTASTQELRRARAVAQLAAVLPELAVSSVGPLCGDLSNDEIERLCGPLASIASPMRSVLLQQVVKINASGSLRLQWGDWCQPLSTEAVRRLCEPGATEALIAAVMPLVKTLRSTTEQKFSVGRVSLENVLGKHTEGYSGSLSDFLVRALLFGDEAGRTQALALLTLPNTSIPFEARQTMAIDILQPDADTRPIHLPVLCALFEEVETHAQAQENKSLGKDVLKAMCRSNVVRQASLLTDRSGASPMRGWARELVAMRSFKLWKGLCLTQFTQLRAPLLGALDHVYAVEHHAIKHGGFIASDAVHRHVAFFGLLHYSRVESYFYNTLMASYKSNDWQLDVWQRVCRNPFYRIYMVLSRPHYFNWWTTLQLKSGDIKYERLLTSLTDNAGMFANGIDSMRTTYLVKHEDRLRLARAVLPHANGAHVAQVFDLNAADARILARSELSSAPSSAVRLIGAISGEGAYDVLDRLTLVTGALVAGAEGDAMVAAALSLAKGTEAQKDLQLAVALAIAGHPNSAENMFGTIGWFEANKELGFVRAYLPTLCRDNTEGLPQWKAHVSASIQTTPAQLLQYVLRQHLNWPEDSAQALAERIDAWPVEPEGRAAAQAFGAIALYAHLLDAKGLVPWLTAPSGPGPQLLADLLQIRVHSERGAQAAILLRLADSEDGRAILSARPHLRTEKIAESRLVAAMLVALEMEGYCVDAIRQALNHSTRSPFLYAPRQRLLLGFLQDVLHSHDVSWQGRQNVLEQLGAGGTGKALYDRLLDAMLLRGLKALGKMAAEDADLAALAKDCMAEHLGSLKIDAPSEKYHATFGSSRAKQAVWVYLATLKRLGDPRIEEAYLRYLGQVLDGTFIEARQTVAGNAQLEALEALRPGFVAAYHVAAPPSTVSTDSATEVEDEKEWLYTRIVTHGHLECDGPILQAVEVCLNPSASSEACAAARLEIVKTHSVAPSPDTHIAQKCLALIDAADSAAKAAAIRDLKTALAALPVTPELFADLSGRQTMAHNQATPALGLLVDSCDPYDLLLCGTDVSGSCQRVNGTPQLNRGLLGTLLNGQTRLLAVKNPATGKIVARRILRALTDHKKPVLYVEPLYGDGRFDASILALARQKAAALGVEVMKSPDFLSKGCGPALYSLGGRAPFEYCDGASTNKLSPDSQFTISATEPLGAEAKR